jgi:hypothetical protein
MGQSNAAAWMDHFRLDTLDLSARPGRAVLLPTMTFAGGVHNVATTPRLKRVAEALTQILGHPMQVEAAPGPRHDHASPANAAPGNAQADAATPAAPDQPSPPRPDASHLDRRDAMSLPLVQDVFEVFPDAMLIHARREPNPHQPPDTTSVSPPDPAPQ